MDVRPLSVCALVPYPPGTAPSQRFRLEQWRLHLEHEGIRLELLPFVDRRLMALLHRPGAALRKAGFVAAAVVRRAVEAARVAAWDAVVVHRGACLLGPAVLERLIVTRRPLIFDFDDAIYLCDTSPANRRLGWLKWPHKTATLCRISSHVTAGSAHLEAWARRHTPHVTLVPSSIDTERYRPQPKPEGPGMVIGWMGSTTSQRHLEIFAPTIREAVARPGVELRVVSAAPPVLPGVRFAWRPWSAATEVEELAGFDVGIMPMPDDAWSQGKCAMKALQYMGMGLATVASPVGATREVIEHGENGLLAASVGEWVEHLTALRHAPAFRARLAAAGRKTVETRYSMRASAAAFGRATREAVACWRGRSA